MPLPELAALRRAVLDGRVQPGAALAIATEFERLRPQLHEAARPTVLDAMVDLGGTHGPRAVRELRQRLVAAYGRAGQLRHDEELAAAHVSLSHPVMDGDLATYSLVLDPEGRAILEAAIGPYARPRPADDGSPDPREPQRRRGEALVAVCRRASSAGSAPGAGLKTCVYVTMSYADLTARLAGVLPGDDHAGNDHEANDHGGNHRGGNHCGGNHRGATTAKARRALSVLPGSGSPSARSTAGRSSRRRRSASSPARPGSSLRCWAVAGSSSSSATRSGPSRPLSSRPSGSGTGTAPSPVAMRQPIGAMPTTSGTGPTSAAPT